jgi:deoxycytidylate deaminase
MNMLKFCADIMAIDTVYLTTSPCRTCIKSLANTGCHRLVFRNEYPHPEAKSFWLRLPGREWDIRPNLP